MSELNRSTPYTDDADDRQGRVAIESTPESWYNLNTTENPGGADETVPYPDEIAHSDEGDFVVLTRNDANEVVPKSASRDLRLKIQDLEKKHVFENAEAFVFNANVNTLYFDSDRMTVKISPERVFSSNYKYWAVKGINVENGQNGYFTGIASDTGNGDIISNLINTDIAYDPDGNPVGVTCSGHLISPLIHGHNYVVQFFDADRILVDQMSFQAYSVRNMTFDTVPENSIIDVTIGSVTGDVITLEQNRSWKDLAIRVYLLYADATARDVTSEWITNGGSTGRVVITGLDDINSNSITPSEGEGKDGFEIKVHYFASSVNIDNPLVDPDNLVITHTYHVKIVPNAEESILSVAPAVWIEGNTAELARLCMKIYGINKDENGNTYFVDHTFKLKSDAINNTDSAFISDGGIQVINPEDPENVYYKFTGTISSPGGNSFNHVIPVKYGTLNQTLSYAFRTNGYYADIIAKYTKPIPGDNSSQMEYEPTYLITLRNDVDGNTRLVMNKDSAHTSLSNAEYITHLKDKFKASINGRNVYPTHIRIRNGKTPSFWHVNVPVELTSEVFTNGMLYAQSGDPIAPTYVKAKTPLIVEFISRGTDENMNYTNTLTGLALFFVDGN